MEIQGYVEHIIFRNEDNGYSVLNVAEGNKEYCLVGNFLTISEGEVYLCPGRNDNPSDIW